MEEEGAVAGAVALRATQRRSSKGRHPQQRLEEEEEEEEDSKAAVSSSVTNSPSLSREMRQVEMRTNIHHSILFLFFDNIYI